MIIDIKNTKTYIISPAKDKYRERLLTVYSRLVDEGFCEIIFIKSLKGNNGTNSLTNTVIKILNDELKNDDPFIIIEDDCEILRKYDNIEVPDNLDALYLGVSKWVYPFSTDTLYTRNRPYIRENTINDHVSYDENLTKINGMTSGHAILFNSREYIRLFLNKIIEIMRYVEDVPHDLLFATLHKHYNIYALKGPMFYQDSKLNGQEKETKLQYNGQYYIYSE
jgi:hypothetical protein